MSFSLMDWCGFGYFTPKYGRWSEAHHGGSWCFPVSRIITDMDITRSRLVRFVFVVYYGM